MRIILLTMTLVATLIIAGCSGEKYGAGVDSSAPKATVKDVFLKKSLLGQKVTLEGNIVSQCQSNGCWFYLRDATGQIYIDLKTHNFTLPSMPNKNVAATGTVGKSQNNIVLIATGVEVK
ncbi:MAG: NirD/YgiW/YdeI family stress tolerance protein [Desulfuromonadales bacterium]|jgi:uncharacterized protein YdeI (BOF family)|nr:NirD/YgiW/YdeI family stress tolerance protein [Desulfuromonadales bacterium]MDH3869090.1 NirD/YgiW/YdeI family stress tolerance protein [Desulfuromonadales bacterium]MDH3959910.1 NirD/YgiW/YdeI family stress tolerance protein [Desulfuromonadales bacterium]MDH4025937.1 NirD/YgiW/YdeI family stress tolerance protein [Desulfuromonadales bacterium]